jgi:alanine transaminase
MEQRRGYLTPITMNKHLRDAKYAVRGELVIKALEYQNELDHGNPNNLPFSSVIACNIGNPQSLGQKPITFTRQVLALMQYPVLADEYPDLFPEDVVARAKAYLNSWEGGMGSYSHSQGVSIVRMEVSRFITARDGVESLPQNIFLSNGASAAVQSVLTALIGDPCHGVMIPTPQYPLYSATISLLGGRSVPYILDEADGWGTSASELIQAYDEAVEAGVEVRAIAVINPGNPTGAVLKEDVMQDILQFCADKDLILLADEVYQENVYGVRPFISFRKVLASMPEIADEVELYSFHSVSKGFFGECGQRGGYMEVHNVDPAIHDELYKAASISLCSNLSGQVVVGCMVNPPTEGDLSYPIFFQERSAILTSLARRAARLASLLNELEGVSCVSPEGAMYAFPTISLSKTACGAAVTAGKMPDTFYCLELLKATGICVVPGSGFGQVDGTWHFRTTFLPSEDDMVEVMHRMGKFHQTFMDMYRDD